MSLKSHLACFALTLSVVSLLYLPIVAHAADLATWMHD
jgi:hypothetical protein